MKSYRVREPLHENLLDHLLLARGVAEDDHEAFLNPDFVRDSHDPFLLPDMERAVDRLLHAAAHGERVAVWSDYDCDGIPGGVLLADFFRTLGLSVVHYIPHRHKEGYGLNKEGLDELAAQDVALVVTVDLGTTEVEHVAYAKTRGIDVIVTDHHLEPPVLPEALAILNPKLVQSAYPFDGLCGAGVAWKLVQAVLQKKRDALAPGQEKWYLDLVGLATLSDMVPLVGENRMLARFGLHVMRRARRPGLAALLSLLRIKPGTLTEDDVGFMVAPRINAASRMDSPEVAARLLGTHDAAEAKELARTLDNINNERKGLVAATVKEANKRLRQQEDAAVIVMGSPSWRPGILGLVAGSLADAHGKPVFLWGREDGELLRGSCRAGGSTNVVELMRAAGDILEHFGGHAASGGFALAPERAHELPARLCAAQAQAPGLRKEVVIDRALELQEASRAGAVLERLSPFGIQNEKPLFVFPGVSVADAKMFGKTQNHLDLTLVRGSARLSGISFFFSQDSFTKKVAPGDRADIVGHIEKDWSGRPRLRVVDVI